MTLTNNGEEMVLNALEAEIRRGDVVFLLDGFDEVLGESLRVAVAKEIERFLSEVGNNLVVVTSRPSGYLRMSRNIRHYRMSFSSEKVREILFRWELSFSDASRRSDPDIQLATGKTEKILNTIAQLEIEDIASNPLVLILLSYLESWGEDIPNNRIKLYQKMIETLSNTEPYWRSSRAELPPRKS